MREITGELTASGLTFTLVVSRFNAFVTDRLLDGAVTALKRTGAKDDAISVVRVPGAWELPMAVRQVLAAKKKPDAVIALGCVIRGGTPHFEYVSTGTVDGCMRAQLDAGVPVALGVLTCDTKEQAEERAGPVSASEKVHDHAAQGHGNKGFEAALAAIEMANLAKRLAS